MMDNDELVEQLDQRASASRIAAESFVNALGEGTPATIGGETIIALYRLTEAVALTGLAVARMTSESPPV